MSISTPSISPSMITTFPIEEQDQILSQSGLIGLVTTSFLAGFVSIVGSSTIVMIMLRQRKEKLLKIHNRLLFGMSSVDIISSSALGISTIILLLQHHGGGLDPNFIYDYEAKGMCSAQGFFYVLGFLSVPIYNSCLCCYYMLCIKYNTKDETLLKLEPYMHGFSIGLPLSVALFGALMDVFHPTLKALCWVGNGCELKDHVTAQQDATSTTADHSSHADCEPRPELLLNAFKYTVITIIAITFLLILFSMGSVYLFIRDQTLAMNKYQAFSRRNSIVGHEEKKAAHEETALQGMLYVISFICTYIFPLVAQVIKGRVPLSIKLLRSVCYPLAGMWNLIIYVRPRYVIVKEDRHGEISFLGALKAVIFPRTDEDHGGDDAEKRNKRKESRLSIIRLHHHSSSPTTSSIDKNDNAILMDEKIKSPSLENIMEEGGNTNGEDAVIQHENSSHPPENNEQNDCDLSQDILIEENRTPISPPLLKMFTDDTKGFEDNETML